MRHNRKANTCTIVGGAHFGIEQDLLAGSEKRKERIAAYLGTEHLEKDEFIVYATPSVRKNGDKDFDVTLFRGPEILPSKR